jgi:hypothetical protein
MIDGTVESGILKYRSMIAKISVAYAELAPEVNITLQVSRLLDKGFQPADLTSIASLMLNFPGFNSNPNNLVPLATILSFASK